MSTIANALLLILSVNMNSHIAMANSPSANTTALLDNLRPLYVFTPSISDPRAVEQISALHEYKKEAEARQLIIVVEDQGQTLATVAKDSSVRLSPQDSDQAAARRRFKVSPSDFIVILAGKDGGEKLRSHLPKPFAKLRETIDSMPMRQQEMRRSK